jgi:hypothetical protein
VNKPMTAWYCGDISVTPGSAPAANGACAAVLEATLPPPAVDDPSAGTSSTVSRVIRSRDSTPCDRNSSSQGPAIRSRS